MISKYKYNIILASFVAMFIFSSCASSRAPYGKKRKPKNCDCPTWTHKIDNSSEKAASLPS